MDVVERLTFEAAPGETLTASEHVQRYGLAAGVLSPGARVADLCCGPGHGSEILAARGFDVVGVDNDAATVDMAKARLGAVERLEFVCADAAAFLGSDAALGVDAVVCFEGLPREPHLDRVAASLRELASRGAQIVLSLPSRELVGPGDGSRVAGFDADSACALFDGIGEHRLVEQHLAEGALLRLPGVEDPATPGVILEERAASGAASHFIGLFNTAAPDAQARLRFALAPRDSRRIRALEEANRCLWRENARLGRAVMRNPQAVSGQHLSAAGESAARLQAETAKRIEAEERLAQARDAAQAAAERRAGLEQELAVAHAEAAVHRDEAAGLRQALASVLSSPSWRMTAPLRTAKRGLARRAQDRRP